MRQQKQQRLIVRNLNFHAKEEDLAKAFSEFGPLAEVNRSIMVCALELTPKPATQEEEVASRF